MAKGGPPSAFGRSNKAATGWPTSPQHTSLDFHVEAARRAAVLYSLTRTCAQYGVPPLEYFTDVLVKLTKGWEQKRLDELLPHRWATRGTEPRNSQGP
jgi:hypothetical protein